MLRVNERQITVVFQDAQPTRLDRFLAGCLAEYSRSRLQELIRQGHVVVGGQVAVKSGMVLEKPVTVEVFVPATQPSTLEPEQIPLQVVFENQDLIVINKPAGMVVHPAAGHGHGTLVHAVLGHAPEIEGVGGEQRPGIVHRLDKDTSGLILVAKNDQAHRWLQDQFRARRVVKVYLALVDGAPPTPVGRVEAPVGRDPLQRKLMAVVPLQKGREAVSEYRVLERFPEHTLLEVHPLTGRTHQIRVHMAFLGCPVTGDTIYGRRRPTLPLERHFLHAAQLTIHLPGEDQPRTFHAPLPPELAAALEFLRR
jgi:23S rRNA pseudouridine1911/1915/1917 synthase